YAESTGEGISFSAPGGSMKVYDLDSKVLLGEPRKLEFSSKQGLAIWDHKKINFKSIYIKPPTSGLLRICWPTKTAKTASKKVCYHYRGEYVVSLEKNWDEAFCQANPKKEEDVAPFIRVTNVVPLETYLKGVVPIEIGAGSPHEALKAQAVAARTFAMYKMGLNRSEQRLTRFTAKGCPDVVATTADQQYLGASTENSKTSLAVEQTQGEVLLYSGSPIYAAFHANSGGRTRSAYDLDGRTTIPYLDSVEDYQIEKLRKAPGGTNVIKLDQKRLAEKLKAAKVEIKASSISGLSVSQRNKSHDVTAIKITGSGAQLEINGSRFKAFMNALGLADSKFNFRRTYFDIEKVGKDFVFKIYGFGWHRAGMSQTGAIYLAQDGRLYQQILNYYYSQISLSRVY
ncbi:MAG: SpoIID/LytB domain-containing protein, partial [Oligoflexia bacterium]|nr:SpoIID/LytB domain-containing protein [Oligoflexia bacterium]